MAKIIVVYHSGYGHTAQVAKAVVRGAEKVSGATVHLISVDDVKGDFKDFADADAIIFGCPTYMGGPSAPFKAFIDSASKVWFTQGWKDKVAAGFTNSGGLSGDKLNTLNSLFVNAMQHGMIWVGNAQMVGGTTTNDINRLSSFTGVMTQSDQGPADQFPPAGDLQTAENFGQRVAEITNQILKGRA